MDPEMETSVDEDLALHKAVLEKGYPNRWGARIPIKTKWNLELFAELLEEYDDKEVVEWIKYGWPSGRLPSMEDPEPNNKNHKGTIDYLEALSHYIQKEKITRSSNGTLQENPIQQQNRDITPEHTTQEGIRGEMHHPRPQLSCRQVSQ